jgi:hypothetical protein
MQEGKIERALEVCADALALRPRGGWPLGAANFQAQRLLSRDDIVDHLDGVEHLIETLAGLLDDESVDPRLFVTLHRAALRHPEWTEEALEPGVLWKGNSKKYLTEIQLPIAG